jgi:hypothetical protein
VHVRYVCIALFILSCLVYALHSIWGIIYFLSPYFLLLSWENFGKYFVGMTKKSTSGLLFCLGNSEPLSLMTGLILPHILGLDIVSFPHNMSLLFFCLIFFSTFKKKKWGRRCRILLIAFQIFYVFLPDISVHCALIEYAYIWLRVYAWYLLSFRVAS